uniref:ShKT domain-containing protein n=1 Tax=Parascaris equorum TaxID=6256 RepID=A0A914RH22_PAREQ
MSILLSEAFHDCVNECCDEHHLCRFWTRIGECSKNPNWMLPNCAKSCATKTGRNFSVKVDSNR